MTIVYILIVAGILVCALMAILARRLLTSALWLAGCSALVAVLLYVLGAPEIAVIELSVGAGLVTVLFVFAINIAGDEPVKLPSLMPRWLAWLFILLAVVGLGWLLIPALNPTWVDATDTNSFVVSLWRNRYLDVILQVALIFAGVLALMGMLSEGKKMNLPDPDEKQEETL